MTADRPWSVDEPEPGTVHVTPVGDLIAHDLTPDCLCNPTPDLVVNTGRPDGWVQIHHSLDGREAYE